MLRRIARAAKNEAVGVRAARVGGYSHAEIGFSYRRLSFDGFPRLPCHEKFRKYLVRGTDKALLAAGLDLRPSVDDALHPDGDRCVARVAEG